LLAIDGSQICGGNARDRLQCRQAPDLIERADARLAEYLQQLDATDEAEPAGRAHESQTAAKIAALQEKQDWHADCWRTG